MATPPSAAGTPACQDNEVSSNTTAVRRLDLGYFIRPASAHYRPQRRDLADAGVTLDDVRLVVNCHLHFDHCGGNPRLGRTPILVQSAELATARHSGYTVEEPRSSHRISWLAKPPAKVWNRRCPPTSDGWTGSATSTRGEC